MQAVYERDPRCMYVHLGCLVVGVIPENLKTMLFTVPHRAKILTLTSTIEMEIKRGCSPLQKKVKLIAIQQGSITVFVILFSFSASRYRMVAMYVSRTKLKN